VAQASLRVAGGLVLGMQTIDQQAGLRLDCILNRYPDDYIDRYPARIGQVTADQVRQVMDKYVVPNRLTIVVVAPAAQVKDLLAPLGDVKVVPMPSLRSPPAESK
jgi:predicted Zn-dependent peptidase